MNRKVGRAVPSPPSRGAIRTSRPYQLAWLMVPMHANNRKGAFNELCIAAVLAGSCGEVPPTEPTPSGTPGELAGEDTCATLAGQLMTQCAIMKSLKLRMSTTATESEKPA
jgi:hypothetical protein